VEYFLVLCPSSPGLVAGAGAYPLFGRAGAAHSGVDPWFGRRNPRRTAPPGVWPDSDSASRDGQIGNHPVLCLLAGKTPAVCAVSIFYQRGFWFGYLAAQP